MIYTICKKIEKVCKVVENVSLKLGLTSNSTKKVTYKSEISKKIWQSIGTQIKEMWELLRVYIVVLVAIGYPLGLLWLCVNHFEVAVIITCTSLVLLQLSIIIPKIIKHL